MIVVYVEYVVYNDDVEDNDVVVEDDEVVVVVIYAVRVVVVKVDVLAANNEKVRMDLRNLQVADDT